MSNINKTITLQFKAETDKAKIKTSELSEAIKGLNQQLTGYSNTRLGTTIRTVGEESGKTYKYIYRLNKEGKLDILSRNIKDAQTKAQGLAKAFKKVGLAALTIKAAVKTVTSLGKEINQIVSYSVEASEALNLFNVAFGNIQENGETTFTELGKEADEFQKKLQKNFGANLTESRTYQALYQEMATAGGIAEEAAAIMSENSTKLVYDLASLFNKEEEDVADNIRSGIYAGQSKVLYQYGIDITDAGMETVLEELKQQWSGLADESISSMTRSEKEMLRYITVLKQTQKAQGDYANTIESPANQLRVLKNEFVSMAATLGNLFVAPFQKILQYANAIIRTVRYVGEAIMSLFNIDTSSYNESVASSSSAWEDLEDNIDDATDSAKKYKKQLLGFDEVNNISESDSSSSSTGVGINEEWYKVLESSIGSYNNGLDLVKLRAETISEEFMNWIGFEYDAEEGIWKFGDAYDNLIESAGKLKDAFVEIKNAVEPLFTSILNNVIKPIGEAVVSDILPGVLDLLSGALKILGQVIEDVEPGLDFLLKYVIKPLMEFAGTLLGDALSDIGTALEKISENRIAMTILEGVLGTIAVFEGKKLIVSIINTITQLGIEIGLWVKKGLAILLVNGYMAAYNIVTGIATTATWLFNAALSVLTSPITLVIAAIALLALGIYELIKHWDDVKEMAVKAWNKIKETWNKAGEWFSGIGDSIKEAFSKTWDKVKNKASETWDKIKDKFKEAISIKIKKPEISWSKGEEATGWIAKALKAIGLDARLPKLSVKWVDAYANGGFPEDGMFFANHGELVGKFSNGKTAVANNEQITEGIRRAVVSGMSEAMSNNGGSTKFEFSVGEGIIVKKVVNGINEITKSTGESPLLI